MRLDEFSIPKSSTFNIEQTLDCGQVFRYIKTEKGYRVCAKNHIAFISEENEKYIVNCDDVTFFTRYFDFDTDYELIQHNVIDDGFVANAVEYGKGIHILKQDPIESLFSFIISQNNHIPRIKSIIERICTALGDEICYEGVECGTYHAFPSVEKLASAGVDFFKAIGAGYRAEYLDRVANALLNENVYDWQNMSTQELRQKLLSLHGVGRKVADCVLLFGFSKFDVFPVDTWIRKAFEDKYPNVPAEKMSDLLISEYGNNAGFVQQWAFYYKRSLDK